LDRHEICILFGHKPIRAVFFQGLMNSNVWRDTMEHIAAANNTEMPAYLALIEEGCLVERELVPGLGERWIVTQGDLRLSGESLLQVSGLYWMRKRRGADWQARDEEVEAFLDRFYPERK
jgi:hypothetical protein